MPCNCLESTFCCCNKPFPKSELLKPTAVYFSPASLAQWVGQCGSMQYGVIFFLNSTGRPCYNRQCYNHLDSKDSYLVKFPFLEASCNITLCKYTFLSTRHSMSYHYLWHLGKRGNRSKELGYNIDAKKSDHWFCIFLACWWRLIMSQNTNDLPAQWQRLNFMFLTAPTHYLHSVYKWKSPRRWKKTGLLKKEILNWIG